MARQKGIIVIKGTVDGFNFYVRKGEPLVRKAGGGFDGNAIKTKPSMVRVRENGSEFGGCTKAAKQFKMALNSFLGKVRDGSVHYRLIQLFSQVKNLDAISIRGERNVHCGLLTDAGKDKLSGYVITSGNGLAQALGQSFQFGWHAEGFTIADFSVSRVPFPKGATHIELQAGYLLIDFQNNEHSFSKSEPFIIEKTSATTFVQIVPEAVPERDKSFKVGVVFLRFMQEVNGVLCPFKQVSHTVLEVVCIEDPLA